MQYMYNKPEVKGYNLVIKIIKLIILNIGKELQKVEYQITL